MQTFALEAIEARRQQFRDQEYPEIPLRYKNNDYTYFVLPHELAPHMPNFVMRMTPPTAIIRAAPHPADIAIFGISNAVREEFRQFCVAHEIEEFIHIGI